MKAENVSPHTNYEHFLMVDIRVGTVLSVKDNQKANKPSYVLEIDFGQLGCKTSSAQIVQNYSKEQLLGRQVIAVVNFKPKKVANILSQVLVLAVVCDTVGNVLLEPTMKVSNGTRVL